MKDHKIEVPSAKLGAKDRSHAQKTETTEVPQVDWSVDLSYPWAESQVEEDEDDSTA